MKIIANGKIRDAEPGDKIEFGNGSVVEVQKNGSFRNVVPKGVGKKQRKRPPKQRKKISL